MKINLISIEDLDNNSTIYQDIELLHKMVSYLSNGNIVIASPGISPCAVLNCPDIAGTSSLLTDGIWVWPDTLAHYVSQHGYALPDGFLQVMMNHEYKMPLLSDSELEELANAIE